ncbi:MAG: hypothetical protein WC438_03470 [Candidatus Pacearchaeota archaeon]
MVKKYIRNDEKYPLFRLVKNDLYQVIEGDGRFSGLIDKIQKEASADKLKIKEKDIKRYIAWIMFHDYKMNRELFFKSVGSHTYAPKVIYGDLKIFSDN